MRAPRAPVKLLRRRLDLAGVEAHLAVVRSQARAIEIRTKGSVASYSEATPGLLDEIAHRLGTGEIVAVQVRFFQDDAWWCDTVVRKGDDFRLVRMQQEEPLDH